MSKTTTLSFNLAGSVDNAQKPRTSQGASGMIMSMLQATPFSSPGIVDGKNVATTTDYSDGLTLPFVGGGAMNYYSSGGTGMLLPLQ